MRHAGGEVRGWCRECIVESRAGGDLPVCKSAEPAESPQDGLCAWCGHEVKP